MNELKPPCSPKGIFITGTDTHVGKSVVTAALGLAFQKQGYRLGVMKPVETGISQSGREQNTDGSRLRSMLAADCPPDLATPYRFPEPIAPLAASRRQQQSIDFERIKNRYQELSKNGDLLLVEGAGGVMVPLTEQQTVRDLLVYLHLPCVVVSRPTLGSVNHTLLTLEALRNRAIPILGIVLNQATSPPTSEIGQLQIDSTRQLIREFSGVPIVGPIPFEPRLETDWEEGVRKMADCSSIARLVAIIEETL